MSRLQANTSRAALVCTLLVMLAGCSLPSLLRRGRSSELSGPALPPRSTRRPCTTLTIDTPRSGPCCDEVVAPASLPPRTLRDLGEEDYWDASLEEIIQLSLANSVVVRDAGGRVLSIPEAVSTKYDPSVIETNPLVGVEAALSAFDAQLETSISWNSDDRVFNNALNTGIIGNRADRSAFNAEISKLTASGGRASARHRVNYVANDSVLNLFPSAYDTVFEAEVRQPLLQGAGIDFNRTAGPSRVPGIYSGVVLARLNTDVSLADLEIAVTGLVGDIERAYWSLYTAYRELDATVVARDAALATWRTAKRRVDVGGGDREEETAAREQYYVLQAQVDNALTGSGNPAAGFQSPVGVGVIAREQQLRLLMGLPANDGRVIRPSDTPHTAPTLWDWDKSLHEANNRRVELRRQQWLVRRRELELLAAKNHLSPRLDVLALYRWYGLGDNLAGSTDATQFQSSYGTLFDGDFQEWQLGVELSVPIGQRAAHNAVRNAQLRLARERAILREQKLAISHDLSDAISQVDRTYHVAKSLLNRLEAARDNRQVVQRKYEASFGVVTQDRLLSAIRRVAEAESSYHRSLVDHTLAITNVFRARGSLLDYNQVQLAEGPSPAAAHSLADSRARVASLLPHKDRAETLPARVSNGPYAQLQLEPTAAPEPQQSPDSPRH